MDSVNHSVRGLWELGLMNQMILPVVPIKYRSEMYYISFNFTSGARMLWKTIVNDSKGLGHGETLMWECKIKSIDKLRGGNIIFLNYVCICF